jgi:hypothetical protein
VNRGQKTQLARCPQCGPHWRPRLSRANPDFEWPRLCAPTGEMETSHPSVLTLDDIAHPFERGIDMTNRHYNDGAPVSSDVDWDGPLSAQLQQSKLRRLCSGIKDQSRPILSDLVSIYLVCCAKCTPRWPRNESKSEYMKTRGMFTKLSSAEVR